VLKVRQYTTDDGNELLPCATKTSLRYFEELAPGTKLSWVGNSSDWRTQRKKTFFSELLFEALPQSRTKGFRQCGCSAKKAV
jgi:hypothetical protein